MPFAPRSFENSILAILYLVGLGLASSVAAIGSAHAEPAAPGQIIGYANADRSGPSQVWALPPDKPYLYIPTIPAALNGKIATVETGPEVGVALFKGPYFTSSDQGCQPALGTPQQPRLAWLGATARFAPTPVGQSDMPPPDAAKDGYGSLIVYRTDLGPPPGALFLSRRITLGLQCANPVHKTVYNRIFVPVAEAPETERCFDLVGNYPGTHKPFQLDFVKSDRLVLMMPGDLSERYTRIRHDYTVTLYDGLSCTGRSATLDSRARLGRDVRLAQMEFRDRTRSIRVSYDYGNADAFLVRREAPAPAPETAMKAPDTGPSQEGQALAAQPIEDPAVGRTAPSSEPMAAPEPILALAESLANAPPVQMTGSDIAAQAAPETLSVAPVEPPAQAAPMPPPSPAPPGAAATAPAQSAEVPASAPKPSAAPSVPTRQALAKPVVQAPAMAQPAAEAPAKTASTVPVGEPVTDTTAPQPPAATPTARTIPKLSPRMAPQGAQTAALPTLPKTFAFPVHDLYRLNHCLYWQRDCGQPAATAWCRARGYSEALDWTVDENIGANFPTVILGNREVCAQADCDGFKEITCRP